jgi:ABC-type uncharacterized transport system substrate-binding protein
VNVNHIYIAFEVACQDAWRAQHRIPAMYATSESVVGGGLNSYGPSISNVLAPCGCVCRENPQGARPAELPVVQLAEFELVLNLKTAKALGLEVPPTMLACADEVIE